MEGLISIQTLGQACLRSVLTELNTGYIAGEAYACEELGGAIGVIKIRDVTPPTYGDGRQQSRLQYFSTQCARLSSQRMIFT